MISVRTGTGRILIGKQLLPQTGKRCRALGLFGQCVIVSDTNIAPEYADVLKQSLTSAEFRSMVITIPAGEKSKTLEQAGAICDRMITAGLDRQSFVIGLGGGMIGDISGFVAAIYHRGIPHVQIPTTLLAMVDSSIGGKTGVNAADGKNLIGAVHHSSSATSRLNRQSSRATSAIVLASELFSISGTPSVTQLSAPEITGNFFMVKR